MLFLRKFQKFSNELFTRVIGAGSGFWTLFYAMPAALAQEENSTHLLVVGGLSLLITLNGAYFQYIHDRFHSGSRIKRLLNTINEYATKVAGAGGGIWYACFAMPNAIIENLTKSDIYNPDIHAYIVAPISLLTMINAHYLLNDKSDSEEENLPLFYERVEDTCSHGVKSHLNRISAAIAGAGAAAWYMFYALLLGMLNTFHVEESESYHGGIHLWIMTGLSLVISLNAAELEYHADDPEFICSYTLN